MSLGGSANTERLGAKMNYLEQAKIHYEESWKHVRDCQSSQTASLIAIADVLERIADALQGMPSSDMVQSLIVEISNVSLQIQKQGGR